MTEYYHTDEGLRHYKEKFNSLKNRIKQLHFVDSSGEINDTLFRIFFIIKNKLHILPICKTFNEFKFIMFNADRDYFNTGTANEFSNPPPLKFKYIGTTTGECAGKHIYKVLYAPNEHSPHYCIIIFNVFPERSKISLIYEWLTENKDIKSGRDYKTTNEKEAIAAYNAVSGIKKFDIM